MPRGIVQKTVEAALAARFGEGKWLLNPSEAVLYLNNDLMLQKHLDPVEVRRVAADAAGRVPHVFAVYTRDRLLNGTALDPAGRAVTNGFYPPRSADLYVLLEPYWLSQSSGTTHGTPFGYDAHVPVIFMGPGIKPGRFNAAIAVNDIAPTLATYLDVETPSGSMGRCLAEILAE